MRNDKSVLHRGICLRHRCGWRHRSGLDADADKDQLLAVLTFLGGIVIDLHWLGGFDTAIICIFAAVTVFGCECILRNAYFRAGEESRPWMFILGSLTVLNAVAVIRHVYDGTFMESILNLCCAVALGTVLMVNLIQRGRNKRELEDE